VPYAVYRGRIFKADDEGTRAVLLDTERADLDISLAGTAPLKSRDNRARSGMPDLAATLEIGPNLNLRLARERGWKLELRVPVRAAFTVERSPQRIGWAASPKLNLDLDVGGWNLGAQAGPLWGDRRQNAYFYEVDAAYASAGRPAYRARGGWAGWQGTLALSRKSGALWTAMYVRSDSLAGARFADSPLVTSRQQWSAGIALAWTLKASDARVPDRE
jgi:outer membrane scaffolding protein for murein synthesis (MipA/OmpV family)